MAYGTQNGYAIETETRVEEAFGETPFIDPTAHEQDEPAHESSFGESLAANFTFTSPFLPGEATEAGESEAGAPEVATFSEMTAELKDSLFREALEQLADEALEAHSAQLSGEYGDHETRGYNAERILGDHFEPLASEAEAMLDHFFERLEGYEAESLTDTEIERISSEVLPTTPMSPASEQFLGGLLRKAGKLVSGAVNLAKRGVQGAVKLAGKGLAAIGKLALGPLLGPLKLLGKFLLKHVVKFALGQLPPTLRPLAQKLSEKLFSALGETHEGEIETHEQMETEAMLAAPDAAHLEAEFDVHVAQLLLTSDEAEMDHLVSGYGESENYTSPLYELDNARTHLVQQLSELEAGENPQPVMEQFLPAFVWPAAKTAITILGRPKLVNFIAGLLSKLIKPLIGAQAAGLLSPAIADAGLRIFGLETGAPEPRAVAAEALAATIEETMNSVAELPPHVLENETLLGDAVREAFENAASSYFPNSVIKPELRESGEHHGMWTRMPAGSGRKRYAKYSDALPVDIPERLARTVDTFGSGTLHDHLRDHHNVHDGRAYKGNVTLYQALPGARASTIARAEGFPASQLHPLTPHAAGALLGQNAALGSRHTPSQYLDSREKLHVNQRLYRVEPAAGRHHHHHHKHHAHHLHSELLINLQRGEIRLWLYLSEPLCQRISADLAKANNAAAAFSHIKPLLMRTTEALKMAVVHQHLPRRIQIVSDKPNLEHKTPSWLRHVGRELAAKIGEWAKVQLAQYLRNNAEEFKRATTSHHDGVTLRIAMTRIPGIEGLRLVSQGKPAKELLHGAWPKGSPAFQVTQHPGYKIHRLRT
jgi:hypothetical protein